MRGELCRTQPEPIKVTQNTQIAIEIVAALDIEHRRHLALGADAHDVVCVQRKFNQVAVLLQLPERMIDSTKSLLRLKSAGKIFLGDIDREEERANTAFLRAPQVPLAFDVRVPMLPPL